MTTTTRILIVDDEEIVRRSHARVLSGDHNLIDAVWNGQQALDALQRDRYDLILLDIRMPGMDGMSVLRCIKERWPDSEVIVITGYPEVEAAKQAVRLGAYDYLAKPLAPDEVRGVAHAAMEHKRWVLREDGAHALH